MSEGTDVPGTVLNRKSLLGSRNHTVDYNNLSKSHLTQRKWTFRPFLPGPVIPRQCGVGSTSIYFVLNPLCYGLNSHAMDRPALGQIQESASERRGNNSQSFRDFCLKAKARIWP